MGEKRSKGFITEEDVSLLLQRYNPTTVLTLLHEVCQVAGPKIDWNALVKRTATGITCAREYQMLWRHLAYCHAMEEKFEDGVEPLDDDSDLEFELEVAQGANDEALTEAAACVKALISSSLPREAGVTNRAIVGVPVTSNISNDQASRVPPEKQQMPRRGNTISIPVSGQKHPLPRVQSAEGLDGNGAAGAEPSKKKRKLWTREEDLELIAAVQKFGEGNWANIVKGEFLHNRTASQLSQRWAIIRKKDGNGKLLAGSGCKSGGSIVHSEEKLATQRALSLALDTHKNGRLSSILSGNTQSLQHASSLVPSTALGDTAPGSASQPHNQLQQASASGSSQKVSMNQLNKPRPTPQKQLVQLTPSLGPNSSIKAAAFAAGGRIATPSTAASLFKAAQSKNVVHIRPGGGVRVSSSITAVASSPSGNSAGSGRIVQPGIAVTVPSSTNSVTAPSSLRNGTHQTQGVSGKSASIAENSSVVTTQRVPPESSSNPTLHDSAEKSTVFSNNVDDLLIEEMKGSEVLELDDIVIQDSQTITPSMNQGADGKSVSSNSPDAEAIMVRADSEAAENKSTGNGANKDQALDAQGVVMPSNELNKIPSTDSVEVLDQVEDEQLGTGGSARAENKQDGIQVEQDLPKKETTSNIKLPTGS